jgi:hypothetical protein
MIHLGDITKLDGSQIPPVDIAVTKKRFCSKPLTEKQNALLSMLE